MKLRYDSKRTARLQTMLALVAAGEFPAQRQDSTEDQLGDLYALALKFGLHDAAHWLKVNMQAGWL